MFYKILESHCANKSKDPESPFFFSVNKNWQKANIWYKNTPLGKNSIGKSLSETAQRAGLPPQNKLRKWQTNQLEWLKSAAYLMLGLQKSLSTEGP